MLHSPSLEHLSESSLDAERSRRATGTCLGDTTVDDNRGGSSVSTVGRAGSGGESVGRRDDCWFGHCGEMGSGISRCSSVMVDKTTMKQVDREEEGVGDRSMNVG